MLLIIFEILLNKFWKQVKLLNINWQNVGQININYHLGWQPCQYEPPFELTALSI